MRVPCKPKRQQKSDRQAQVSVSIMLGSNEHFWSHDGITRMHMLH